jgi:hypothetical protein
MMSDIAPCMMDGQMARVRQALDDGGPEDLDRHIGKLRQFAASGLSEVALRLHDDPADSIRMLGERVLPALED